MDKIEKILDDFQAETGIWPPGRSMPGAMCGGEDKRMIQARAFELWRKYKQLEAEIEGLLKPKGDTSPEQQSWAWKQVYDELCHQGISSFIPEPPLVCVAERARQYIRYLKTRAEQALKEQKNEH